MGWLEVAKNFVRSSLAGKGKKRATAEDFKVAVGLG